MRLLQRALLIVSLLASRSAAGQALRDTLQPFVKTAQSSLKAAGKERKPILFDYGVKQLQVDQAALQIYRNDQLSKLIAQQLPVFVRSYGVNGPANLTLRGASAVQTAVLWNDVPLQNGATGLVDLLLIPVGILDDVAISYGSIAGKAGNGAVGGVLSLNNAQPLYRQHYHSVTVSGAAGSFGQYQSSFRINASSGKWDGGIGGAYSGAGNHFSYTDLSGKGQRLVNSRIAALNIQGNLSRRISTRSSIDGNVWAGKNNREIPPALFEQYSVKQQYDESLRSLLRYRYAFRKGELGAVVSLMDEWFRYSDTAAAIQTNIHTRQWYAAPSVSVHPFRNQKYLLRLSLPLQWNRLVGEPGKELQRTALAADLSGMHRKASFNANARAESVNGKVYGAGGLNAGWQILERLELRGSAGYAYRTPTLNELYYTPGGNKDLLPEQGYHAEAGYAYSLNRKQRSWSIRHSTTVFYRDIDNWILWFGGAIWTPHNIARVISRGIETENRLTWSRPKLQWQIAVNASFISSRTRESRIVNDGSIGRQIPYAPRMAGQGNAGVTGGHWRLNYNQTYTGTRYYNTDETGALPAYALGNVQAGYLWKKGGWGFDLAAQINNIWNHRYIEVSGRPAPGINWLLGITVSEKSSYR